MKFLMSLLVLIPTSLFADEMHDHMSQPQMSATFTNRVNSYAMVSPAQIRRSNGVMTDVVYNVQRIQYRDNSLENKDKGFTWTDNTLAATVLYSIPDTNLNVGVRVTNTVGSRHGYSLHLGSFDVEGGAPPDLQSSHTKYWRIDSLVVSPMANYWINDMISVGLRINSHGVHRDVANTTGLDVSGVPYYGEDHLVTVMPAVSVATDNIEAGVAYSTTTTNLTRYQEEYFKERHPEHDFEQPNHLLVHGRYAATPSMKVGGIYRFEQYSMLRNDRSDRSVFSLNGEMQMNNINIEGEMTHAMAFYDKRADIEVSNIATTAARTAVDYRLNDNSSLGAGIGYRYGADEENNTKYRISELAMTVRGSYLF